MQPSHPYYLPDAYSANSDPFSADPVYKKRKIERACDACRRRKTKCDGPRMPDNICTNCVQHLKTCSYIEASKPRGPPKAYITGLEDRLEKMEALLKRLRPESDFSEELGPRVVRDSWKADPELPPRASPHAMSSSSSAPSLRPKASSSGSLRCSALPPVGVSNSFNPSSCIDSRSRRSAGTPRTDTESSDGYTSSDSEEVGELSLSRGMKRLTIRGLEPAQDNPSLADSQVRFHGKSSWFKLIKPTQKLRDEHMHRVSGGDERDRSIRDSTSPVNAAALRRPEFWTTPPWEARIRELSGSTQKVSTVDLANDLLKLYFEHVNPQFPLLHRSTLERQWKEGLQHKDPWFGCLCLALFAVSSRWSDDPRVLDEGKYDVPEAERPTEEHKWQRAGWRYFNAAVDLHRDFRSLFNPPGLFEVQTMSLLGMFLRGTAFHPVGWLFISIGLRKAQDVGAHRKKIYGDKPSVEEELWKRAFWMLVLYDRIGSAALGRPCCSGEEDFDVDLPLEVDDEYWEPEDAEKAFQQPPDKPSRIAAFNSYLKLTKIAAYAMRTIYALDRSKLLVSAARPRWQEVLVQLNNAMTEWVDSIPSHLQWSPHPEDPLFANQSATLYITYYLIQIIIYRPFLPPSLRSATNTYPHSNMPIPSIAICVNAARCCSRILKAQITRGLSNTPSLICSAHMCAAILLMNYWDLKWQERHQLQCDDLEDIKSPLTLAMAELLEDVSVFIEALELVRPRWRNAEMYLSAITSS
ncbi:fungal-specific transcription factor domain-containing protein [Melanogaster broomeanus]|nr:fungal-specific transcription factor domain-containing protein [Melanogaster broomeanus]